VRDEEDPADRDCAAAVCNTRVEVIAVIGRAGALVVGSGGYGEMYSRKSRQYIGRSHAGRITKVRCGYAVHNIMD
jgi:hypothetical protein